MGILSLLFGNKKKRQVFSDEEIDLSPPGVEGNETYYDTDFHRCQFKHTGTWPHHFANCHFIDCEFEFRKSGRDHSSPDCKFDNCIFNFLKAYQFMFSYGQEFHSCTFKGTLKDSVFAIDPEEKKYSRGGIFDCDFKELKFNLLDFRGQNHSRNLFFPPWPIAVLHYGAHFTKEYRRDYFPIELRYFNFGYSYRREGFTVIDLSKTLNNPEDLWAVAYDAPFLNFADKLEKSPPATSETTRLREQNIRHNRIHQKYRETFYSLIQQASITSIIRMKKDIFLSIVVKDLDDASVENNIQIKLIDCSKAEFVDGNDDRKADGYSKKFYIAGMDINEDTDTVILKGPRKTMGRLHLSYSKAQVKGN